MSHFLYIILFFIKMIHKTKQKVVELVGGGSVINGACPSSFSIDTISYTFILNSRGCSTKKPAHSYGEYVI